MLLDNQKCSNKLTFLIFSHVLNCIGSSSGSQLLTVHCVCVRIDICVQICTNLLTWVYSIMLTECNIDSSWTYTVGWTYTEDKDQMGFVQSLKGLWLRSLPQPLTTYHLANMHFSICTPHPNQCIVDVLIRFLVCFKCCILPILCISKNAVIFCLFCGRNEKYTLHISMFNAQTLLAVSLAICTELEKNKNKKNYCWHKHFILCNREKQTENSDRDKWCQPSSAFSVTVSRKLFSPCLL